MFNHFAINPAYAGSRDAFSVVVVNRNQWVGIEGAPNTQTIAAHTPTSEKKVAWGFNFTHDKYGPTNNILVQGTSAYHLLLNKATLAFGLRGGVYNSVMNGSQLNFREENDAVDTKQRASSLVPSFDFGVYYYTDKFYIGASTTHLTKHRLDSPSLNQSRENFLRRHFFLSSGYVIETKRNILIKPSILFKYVEGNGPNIDLNTVVLLNKYFWLGFGVRNLSSINLLTNININKFMRIGYSYDINLNKLNNYSNGSHEILIGIDFSIKKQNATSPRYF
jgi:type IX secretion system PorP/SprF family membrane protein